MKSTVVAMDFGTSKIVTLIAAAQSFGMHSCDIRGVGRVSYHGFSNGEWNETGEIKDVVTSSIQIAQNQADNKIKINEIYVGVPGEFTHIRVFHVSVDIQGSDPRVTSEHVNKIFELADEQLAKSTGDGVMAHMPGVVIHRSPAWFMVDSGKKTLEPVNHKGRELSAMVCFILADQCFPNYINSLMNDLKINVTGFYSSLMGQARLYIPESERDNMAALIDVGYLNTDFIIVEGDAIVYQETIPIGGGHIAAALATELELDFETTAETLKKKFEFYPGKTDKEYEIQLAEGTQTKVFTQTELDSIVLPIVDSLCESIKDSIDKSGCRLKEKSNIYLTGGGLVMNGGAREYMSNLLGRTIREPQKATINMTEPYFSSSMGLLDIILATMNAEATAEKGIKGFFANLFSF